MPALTLPIGSYSTAYYSAKHPQEPLCSIEDQARSQAQAITPSEFHAVSAIRADSSDIDWSRGEYSWGKPSLDGPSKHLEPPANRNQAHSHTAPGQLTLTDKQDDTGVASRQNSIASDGKTGVAACAPRTPLHPSRRYFYHGSGFTEFGSPATAAATSNCRMQPVASRSCRQKSSASLLYSSPIFQRSISNGDTSNNSSNSSSDSFDRLDVMRKPKLFDVPSDPIDCLDIPLTRTKTCEGDVPSSDTFDFEHWASEGADS